MTIINFPNKTKTKKDNDNFADKVVKRAHVRAKEALLLERAKEEREEADLLKNGWVRSEDPEGFTSYSHPKIKSTEMLNLKGANLLQMTILNKL